MKSIATIFTVAALSLSLVALDAEAARRLGNGRSTGMQRQSISPQKPATPPATPAQNAAANPSPMQSAPTAPPPSAQPKRSWMGPLAGLAAGLGLAALASHFGFGQGLANMMLIGLLVLAVIAVVGSVMRRRATAMQPAAAGAPWQSAPVAMPEATPQRAAFTPAAPIAGGVAAAAVAQGANVPADFDSEGFLRQAKVSFLRLQAANDARNLDDIREFTTPEMFGEIKAAIMERGNTTQETDVAELNAQVLDVAEEADRHIVSVRFIGTARMDRAAEVEAIDEIWHIVKPTTGNQGWMLAGIQQIQ